MRDPRRSEATPGVKLLAVSATAGLLSVGLCGMGGTGGPVRDFLATAGAWLAMLAMIAGAIGMILFLFTDPRR